MLKKTESGWLVDIQPGGRGQTRMRKSFRTKSEAQAWENWTKSETNKNRAWTPQRRDTRRLTDLIDLWYDAHGQHLRSGSGTKTRLMEAAAAMQNPTADNFSASTFTRYRSQRLETGTSPATMNRELAYLRALWSELIRTGAWKTAHPLAGVRQIAIQQAELTYLNQQQIFSLLKNLGAGQNPHTLLVAKICLSIGARWSESERLRLSQVRDGKITLARTKTNRVRTVPITDALQREIRQHAAAYPQQISGAIFSPCYSAFREGIKRAGIELPAGQLTHVLRHSFASHYMMNGGNILTLQKILGHQDLKTTMRYAHVAPKHLESARTLNPLNFQRTAPDSELKKALSTSEARQRMMKDRTHDDAMAETFLKDPAYAVELLNSILKDGDRSELPIALRQMTKAFG